MNEENEKLRELAMCEERLAALEAERVGEVVLADRKGYKVVSAEQCDTGWAVCLVDHEGRWRRNRDFFVPTYSAAELKARAYLETLSDEGEK